MRRSSEQFEAERRLAGGYLDEQLQIIQHASVSLTRQSHADPHFQVSHIPVSDWMEEIARAPDRYRAVALPPQVAAWLPTGRGRHTAQRVRTELAVHTSDDAMSYGGSTALVEAGSEGTKLASLFDGLKTQWELANIVLEDQEEGRLPKYRGCASSTGCLVAG